MERYNGVEYIRFQVDGSSRVYLARLRNDPE